MIKTFEKTPLKLNFSRLSAGDLFEYAGDVYIKGDVDNIGWRIDKNEVKTPRYFKADDMVKKIIITNIEYEYFQYY